MPDEKLYRDKMEQGRVYLGVGNLDMASTSFSNAARIAPDDTSESRALHMQGVVLRLMKNFKEAHDAFDEACILAKGDTHRIARILRDKGMCFLDQADQTDTSQKMLDSAMWCIETSIENLQLFGDKVEADASRGFLARVYLKQGDREWAEMLLRQVHRDLRGRHPVYEMNVLPWLGRLSLSQRWLNAPRALYLGLRHYSDNSAKLKEYVALLVGGERLRDALHARRR